MRLFRPYIPLKVRCQVAERQLAQTFGCDVSDLRLDHDPPLALRPQERRGLGKKTYYIPDANDPEHLFYRPQGTQFEGSHDVKTRIRGDHGQFSDIALIKRQRRREHPKKKKVMTFVYNNPKLKPQIAPGKMPKRKWPSRPFNRGKK